MDTLLVRWPRGYHIDGRDHGCPGLASLARHPPGRARRRAPGGARAARAPRAGPARPGPRAPAGAVRVSLAAQPRLAELLAGAGAVGEAVSFDSLGLEGLFADAPVPAALADRLGRDDA